MTWPHWHRLIPEGAWRLFGRYLFWRNSTPRGQAWGRAWAYAWNQAAVTALASGIAAMLVLIARHYLEGP